MNLEDIVGDINHEKPLLLQLHCQLVDMSPFTHRKVIGGFIHDDHPIAESNGTGDFEGLLFAPREQRDLIIHVNSVPQAEVMDYLCTGLADYFLIQKRQAEDALDRFSPKEIITSNG